MRAFSRCSVVAVIGLALTAGFMVPGAAADPNEPVDPVPQVRVSIQNYWQARSNFARSNFARSNFARSNFGALQGEAVSTFGLGDEPLDGAVQRAIDPGQYRCGPTAFDDYVDGLLAGVTPDELSFVVTSGALEFPAMEAMVFGSGADDAVRDGRTHALEKTLRTVGRFWTIPDNEIELVGMQGAMLRDPQRIRRLLVALYGYSNADAEAYATAVAEVITQVPAFADGDNPLFTLGAFSFSGEGDPDPLIAALGDKIVIGDGFLGALTTMGIDDVGARVVLAHEYAHHLQADLGLFDSPLTGAEATRRTELLADAYAGYLAAHARGLSLNAKRVVEAQQTFFELGDCSFADPGHHGTPDQGVRASAWGTDLASRARPQGHILSAADVATLFDAQLPKIVAPDA
jgi:hypothetical protein